MPSSFIAFAGISTSILSDEYFLYSVFVLGLLELFELSDVPGLLLLLLELFWLLFPGLFVVLSSGLLFPSGFVVVLSSGLSGSLVPGLSSGFVSDFFSIQSTLAVAVPLFPALSANSKVNSPFFVKV